MKEVLMHPGSVRNMLQKASGQHELDEKCNFHTTEDHIFSQIKILVGMICLL